MATLTSKLEKPTAKKAAGKRAVVKVGDEDYEFVLVAWGGTSPRVVLRGPHGQVIHTAADWRKMGARI